MFYTKYCILKVLYLKLIVRSTVQEIAVEKLLVGHTKLVKLFNPNSLVNPDWLKSDLMKL